MAKKKVYVTDIDGLTKIFNFVKKYAPEHNNEFRDILREISIEGKWYTPEQIDELLKKLNEKYYFCPKSDKKSLFSWIF